MLNAVLLLPVNCLLELASKHNVGSSRQPSAMPGLLLDLVPCVQLLGGLCRGRRRVWRTNQLAKCRTGALAWRPR